MCPTPLGRVETRVAILIPPMALGLILYFIDGRWDWLVLVGIYLLMGVALDTAVYSWMLKYQPPWMTFVLALVEFGLLYVLAQVLKLDLTPAEAIIFYWVCWVTAVQTKIVILPILSLTYLESAFEFRAPAWSQPPSQVPVPVIASIAESVAGPVVRNASGAHAVPLKPTPSPSGVHAVLTGDGPPPEAAT